jgi:hypothetical protein
MSASAAKRRPEETGFAQGLVHRWARLYTTGMSLDRQERRRSQIESDVFEHRQDRIADGSAAASINLEILGRCLRGVPEDLLWRYRAEGIHVNIKLGFDRIAAIMLLGMVIFIFAGSSIAGYDSSAENFDGELRRVAGINANANIFVFTMSGVGLLGAAAGLITAFREKSPALSTLCGIGLVATGILVFMSTALYAAFAELADEYVATSGPAAADASSNARTVLMVMQATAGMTTMLGGASVWGIALLAAVRGLVPRWFGVLPVASAAIFVLSAAASHWIDDSFAWLAFMVAIVGSALWLVLAAGWLLMGGSGAAAVSGPRTRTAV